MTPNLVRSTRIKFQNCWSSICKPEWQPKSKEKNNSLKTTKKQGKCLHIKLKVQITVHLLTFLANAWPCCEESALLPRGRLKESVNAASGLKPERLESDSVSVFCGSLTFTRAFTGMLSFGFCETMTGVYTRRIHKNTTHVWRTRWWLRLCWLLCLCQHVTTTRPKCAFWGIPDSAVTLTFWPQNLTLSFLPQIPPMTHHHWKFGQIPSTNTQDISLAMFVQDSRMHARTLWKHNAPSHSLC